jgi:hypothetical protein
MRRLCKVVTILSFFAMCAQESRAQDLAEASALNSNSAIATQSSRTVAPTLANPAKQSPSPHLLERTGPPPSEVNRKEFEDNAGQNAGKLLFRSIPSGAEIYINDRLVGQTPLLLVVAPGKYKVAMRGPREESGRATVGVLPKETQNVVINLTQRYPASISTR